MLDDKQKILNQTEFINERKNAKIVSKFMKAKRLYLFLSVLFCLVLIAIVYFVTDYSNIYRIAVEGNVYLKNEDVVKLSGISTKDKYLLVNSNSIEYRIKSNPLIDICDVEKLDDRVIKINIVEKKIIGYALEENNNVLILADDGRLVLDKDNFYLIEKVPLLEGFSKEQLVLIEKNLQDVDYRMINEISEIHYYRDLKFLDHELIMRDGNYIFSSVYGIERVNKYYNMVTSTDGKNRCYYIEDISGNAYTSACPWEPQEEDKENKDVKQEEIIDEE